MMTHSLPRRFRVALAALATLLGVLALMTAAPASRAWADELSGSAIVEYTPQSWPFSISASGCGQLELVEVLPPAQDAPAARQAPQAAAPGIVVRDGTVDLEVLRGQELAFRAVPDPGASLVSVRIGGEDASDAFAEDGTMTLTAEEAHVDMVVVFGDAAPGGNAAAGSGGKPVPIGLTRTGDCLWIGASALVLLALCAWCTTRCASRCRVRVDDASKVQPHESA
ncbi:hypothetical protein H8S61_05685 [Eggerthella sp. NSJ-70]|uniref:Uncharacterized protein n=1 Tax=Eggerthella hominis TaxID=2763043 RepID=A0ABR7BQ01_9ACTN|nr:hypothetical protein [Eggerthella hominis]MBC5583684.1 hypothetical protein [Eggerthella hominis]